MVTVPSASDAIVALLDGVAGIDFDGHTMSARIETDAGPIEF